jgi:prepilin-type N-terminal cleavage/methylation domain-containing protein
MRKSTRVANGFTLIELVIVVLIMGILAAVAVPSYMRSMENSKADDALSMLAMIGATNRMFGLDHSGSYATGSFPTSGACGSAACPTSGPYNDPCALVWCGYLADTDWGSKPYQFAGAGNATATAACTISGSAGTNVVACAKRKSGDYAVWWYAINKFGVYEKESTAPATPL